MDIQKENHMKNWIKTASLVFSVFYCAVSFANSNSTSGIIQIKSEYSVSETIKRFKARARNYGLKIIYEISHDNNAASVEKVLRPTHLLMFGNPKVGTALMQCNQNAGLDLPQKVLIWRNQKGEVMVSYNNVKYIENRHSLSHCKLPIDKIANNLKNYVLDVTRKQIPCCPSTKPLILPE